MTYMWHSSYSRMACLTFPLALVASARVHRESAIVGWTKGGMGWWWWCGVGGEGGTSEGVVVVLVGEGGGGGVT